PVQEAGLIEIADRIGLAKRRQPDDLDPVQSAELVHRRTKRLLAVAEVRAEADIRTCHGGEGTRYPGAPRAPPPARRPARRARSRRAGSRRRRRSRSARAAGMVA